MLAAKWKVSARFHVLVLVGGAIGLATGAFAQSTRYTCLNDTGERAITACNSVLKDNSSDPEAYLSRGAEYARKNDQKRAIADYDQALQLNPQYALAYYNRGLAYESRDELGRALADFRRAQELSSNDLDVKRAIARLSGTGTATASPPSTSSTSGSSKPLFGNFFSSSTSSNNDVPPATARASAASSTTSRLEALERLGKLRNSGVLSKQEFEQEKARILKE
jgi:tetratricopeptide (TPR) repeat protein